MILHFPVGTDIQCCGFVNFERLDSAVAARTALNGYEMLGSDVGPVRIGYARVQTKSPLLGGLEDENGPHIGQVLSGLTNVEGAVSVSTEQQLSVDGGGVENYRSPLVLEMVKNGIHEQVLEKGLAAGGVVSEQQMIMQVLSSGRSNEDADVKASAGESRSCSSSLR
jgi:protein JSN1